jgi:glycerol-3-phosphate dehydrogenase
MFQLFEYHGHYYIQHSGGKYFQFRYMNEAVANQVCGNLKKSFQEQPDRVPRRLASQFTERIDKTELVY